MTQKPNHAMTSSKARRVQLTGMQLKEKFRNDYTENNNFKKNLGLSIVEPSHNISYTIKVGINWQFKLGKFTEIENIGYTINNLNKTICYNDQNNIFNLFYDGTMFEKYSFPSMIFVCRENYKWVLFNSKEIINYIISNIRVRILESGRVKIDLWDQKREKYFAVFTLEYRFEKHKRSFVFGAHGGGAGRTALLILKNNCNYNELDLIISPSK